MGATGREGSTSSLVVEDTAEMIAIGKDVRLVRKVRTARVDEIDAREAWPNSVFLA